MARQGNGTKGIGVFGGSFDPVHLGHLGLAKDLCRSGRLERVILVPAARPPHKLSQELASNEDRLAMIRLAIADIDCLEVSDYELRRDEVSYTIHTARHFHGLYADRLVVVLGADSLADLHLWYEAAALVSAFEFIVYRRPESPIPSAATLRQRFGETAAAKLAGAVVEGEEYAASSSQAREHILHGKDLSGLLSRPVVDYITATGLYGAQG